MAKKIDCTRSEKEPDRERERERQHNGGGEPREDRRPARAERIKREADAVGADAEEHHVGEGDDPGVAKEDVVGRDEQDHHADLRGRVQRLRARKQERGDDEREHDGDDQDLQRPAAGRVAGEERHRPLTG